MKQILNEFSQVDSKGQVCGMGLLNVEHVGVLGKTSTLSRLDEWEMVTGGNEAAAPSDRPRKQE